MGAEGVIESALPGGMDGIGLAVVDLVRGHQTEAEVVVVLIVPGEELPAELLGILAAAEALGKPRLVFEGFEVALGERIMCALPRCIALPGENPGRQTLAPAGSTRGGSGGDEWSEALREKAP